MLVPTFLVTFRWGHRRSQSGLGFTQYSVRHTHLALTAQRVGDSHLRGLPRMLWSPSSFEGEGKRGVHGISHQFQQLSLRSLSADDAAHAEIDICNCSSLKRVKAGFPHVLFYVIFWNSLQRTYVWRGGSGMP